HHVLGDLEVGQPLAGEVQRATQVEGAARGRHDDRADLLPHHLVGYADDRDLEHAGRGGQGVLHLDAVDVLAAAVDDVLGAVDDVDQAVGVDAGPVAGVQPAVAERRGGGLGV